MPILFRFDIFAAHSRWSFAQAKILIPEGFTFTILRDPVDTFESFFSYMGVDKRLGVDINQFAWQFATKEGFRPRQVSWGRNRQLYDLGMDEHHLQSEERVREKIKELDTEFDQVLILEYLDEGLVLLANNLCWPLDDIRSVRLNSRKEKFVSKITKESRDILTDWLWADFLLYQHFLQKHRNIVQQFGSQKLIIAVGSLRSMNIDLANDCTESSSTGSTDRMFKPSNTKIEPVIPQINKSWCKPYYRTEMAYTKRIRSMNILLARAL